MSDEGYNPLDMSGVMHGDGWEMTNEQYDRWYLECFEPQDKDGLDYVLEEPPWSCPSG